MIYTASGAWNVVIRIYTWCTYAFAHTHPSLQLKCFKSRHMNNKNNFRKRNADDQIVNKRFLVLPAFSIAFHTVNRTKILKCWKMFKYLCETKWNNRKVMRHPFIVTFRQFQKRWRFRDSEDFCVVRELYRKFALARFYYQLSRFPLWKYLT